MAIIRDSVVTEYEAVIAGFLRDVRKASDEFSRGQNQNRRASDEAGRAIIANNAKVGSSIKALAAGVAGAFTGRELIGILDNYTKLQNALSIAGLEGDKLTAVQDRLLASAQRTGAGINNLAQLYGNLTTLQKDLGISSEETLRLTDAVANSIKIAGTSPEQARGAILGLNQALAQGRVQGDEY
ncbi:MAG: tape measure protein, partial [Shewanella sp.]